MIGPHKAVSSLQRRRECTPSFRACGDLYRHSRAGGDLYRHSRAGGDLYRHSRAGGDLYRHSRAGGNLVDVTTNQ